MIRKETIDAYKKITPSSQLKNAVLASKTRENKKRSYRRSSQALLIAASVTVVLLGSVVTMNHRMSDPQVMIISSAGDAISTDSIQITSEDMVYVTDNTPSESAKTRELSGGAVKSNACMKLMIQTKELTAISVDKGTILTFHKEKSVWQEHGMECSFDSDTTIYWNVEELELGQKSYMNVSHGKKNRQIEISRNQNGYNVVYTKK